VNYGRVARVEGEKGKVETRNQKLEIGIRRQKVEKRN
jgi:hypothetical protein